MIQFDKDPPTGSAQQRLEESEGRLKLLTDNMSQMAYVATSDMRVQWVNKRWLDYTGMSVEQINQGGWATIVHPDDMQEIGGSFEKAAAEGTRWEKEFRLRDQLGGYRWFLSISMPIKDEVGVVKQWFGTNTDITDRKLVEKERAAAAKSKDQFLATLAHELRNPLAPLQNGLELLEMTTGDAGLQQEARNMMKRQLDQLVRLVDDLMDLSRISHGHLELKLEEVDLQEVTAIALEALRATVAKARHHLHVEGIKGKLMVAGDRHRLVQVVSHLLENATKFTAEQGEITLALTSEDGSAVMAIRDNGIGIDRASLPGVFEMFAHVAAHDKKHGGSGLGVGLSIAKQIVELHGGSIEGLSAGEGKGSEFIVRIPLLAGSVGRSAAQGDSIPGQGPAKKRVLVVDDNRDAVFSMGALLRKLGHTVATAYDGQEALSVGAAFDPDLVLMDIGMPKLNGYEACARMRQADWGRKAKIVALSGWGQEEDRRLSKEAGFNLHVVKPIDRVTILQLVSA